MVLLLLLLFICLLFLTVCCSVLFSSSYYIPTFCVTELIAVSLYDIILVPVYQLAYQADEQEWRRFAITGVTEGVYRMNHQSPHIMLLRIRENLDELCITGLNTIAALNVTDRFTVKLRTWLP